VAVTESAVSEFAPPVSLRPPNNLYVAGSVLDGCFCGRPRQSSPPGILSLVNSPYPELVWVRANFIVHFIVNFIVNFIMNAIVHFIVNFIMNSHESATP
jgi:hypothetical protein